MAHSTANINLGVKSDADKIASPVLTGLTIGAGCYVAGGTPSHGTAGNRGYLQNMEDDLGGLVPLGLLDQAVVGNGTLFGSVNLKGSVVRRVAMTDVAGTIADTWLPVYAVDNQTFSLTQPTTIAVPVGITVRFNAVDDFDVFFFGAEVMLAMSLCGYGRQTWNLGTVCVEGAAAGNLITGIVSPWHGLIVAAYAVCISDPADANVHMDVEIEIGGVNVTGGTMTLDFTDTIGLKKAGTAITALNRIHPGDLIDVESLAAGFVAGTAGDGFYNIYADVRLLPGT